MINWFLSLSISELLLLALAGLALGAIVITVFYFGAYYLFSRVLRELAFISLILTALVFAPAVFRALIMFLNTLGGPSAWITPNTAAYIGIAFAVADPFLLRKKWFADVNTRIARSRQQSSF